MNITGTEAYRAAFVQYLRTGSPIRLCLYAFEQGVEGAFRRLSDQIADVARSRGPGAFSYDFGDVYDFGSVAFPHGNSEVSGIFLGVADDRGAMLAISGDIIFTFSDVFADPLGLGVEPGGTPYGITGSWTANFAAAVLKDRSRSFYFDRNKGR